MDKIDSTQEDELLLADEDEEILPDSTIKIDSKLNTWKVMIVDDDIAIHEVMRFSLKTFLFQEKKLNLIFAH